MNVRDSEAITGLLKNSGYSFTEDKSRADVIIFNTCSVRQHAEDRVFSLIGEYKSRQSRGQSPSGTVPLIAVPLIGIVGCMAQNYKEKIFDKAPDVDFVVGPGDIAKIPGIIKKILRGRGRGQSPDRHPAVSERRVSCFLQEDSPLFQLKIWETDGESRPEEIYHTGFYEDKKHAYVVISEGCSNFCSYCIVPYVRGKLRHRNHKDIIQEIGQAVDNGIKSVTLLGQNVNAYKDGGMDFIKLVGLVNALKGLKEFTFMTSHPKDASSDLFKAIANLDKLKKSLHLPVQSGSDRILKLMNRGYTRKFYLAIADNYRKIVKGGTLTTDIIVGFPTESEADFKDTYSLIRDVGFNSAYIFKYSPRPGTKAMEMPDDIAKEEKEKRHKDVLDLQRKISSIKNAQKNN